MPCCTHPTHHPKMKSKRKVSCVANQRVCGFSAMSSARKPSRWWSIDCFFCSSLLPIWVYDPLELYCNDTVNWYHTIPYHTVRACGQHNTILHSHRNSDLAISTRTNREPGIIACEIRRSTFRSRPPPPAVVVVVSVRVGLAVEPPAPLLPSSS